MKPAIVLSAHTTGTGIIRALGEQSVPVMAVYYEDTDMGYVSKYVQSKISAPHPEHEEKEFIELLLDYASQFGNGVLMPADDATLVAVSKNKELLSRHYIVACNEWDVTRSLIQKDFTYKIAQSYGIPVPQTIVPKNLIDVEKYAETANFPCLLKPCESHKYFEIFRRKVYRARNADELIMAYNQASEAGLEVLLQEYIPGDDTQGVNYNSYYWDGKPLAEYTARKVRLYPPEFGVPRVLVSRSVPEVIGPGRKILAALNYHGYACTEFKKDSRDGIYKFMEVNGRHNRSLLLAVKCGVNFPLLEYNHLVYGYLPGANGVKKDVYWIDFTKDLIGNVRYRKRENLSLAQYMTPYFKPHLCAIFSLRDPMPFITRCIDILMMGIKKYLKINKRKKLNSAGG
jgi:D-aspartate ligase